MKKLLITVVLFLPMLVFGQTPTENYVKKTVYQVPTQNGTVSDDNKIESVTYLDGLGRPIEIISQRAGGGRQDLITPIYYDALGRKPKDYLPLPLNNNDGEYYTGSGGLTIEAELKSYYKTKFPKDFFQGSGGLYPDGWDNPYSNKQYDVSPLSKIQKQGAPGMEWRVEGNTDRTIKFGYELNLTTEVRLFSVNFIGGNTTQPQLVNDGYYGAGELFKNITKDENWVASDGIYGITYEFINKLGQVILQRKSVKDPNRTDQVPNYHDTYFVYDDDGNLTYVLSPKASENILDGNGNVIQNVLDNLGYQYKYDYRNRLIEKKVSGKGWEYVVYDKLDRPILTQDANLREKNQWIFTKYDAFDRIVYSGIFTSGSTRESIQNFVNLGTVFNEQRSPTANTIGDISLYYSTTQAYPFSPLQVLTVNYYDSYVDTNGFSIPASVYGVSTISNPKGLPTVSRVRVLETSDWIVSFTGYDDKGRSIYAKSINEYLDTDDSSYTQLDFTGKVVESRATHNKNGNPIIYQYDYFYYDHMGRLLSHTQKLDNEPVQLIAENSYDELGQLVRKNVGGETYIDGYTDLTNVDVTFDGTIISTDSSYNWPCYLKTKGKIPKEYNGGIKATLLQDNTYVRLGLVKSSSSNSSNEYLDYGISTFFDIGTGQYYLGLVLGGTAITGNYGTYQVGDILKVERVDNLIKFYKNTSLLTTVPAPIDPFIAKVAFSGPTGSVEDLVLFGTKIDKKLQHIDYKYNVRGWLTDINDLENSLGVVDTDLFKFRINYNRIEGNAVGEELYNGNIAQTIWKSANDFTTMRSYAYSYDDLNRLKTANGYKGATFATMTISANHDVGGIIYDYNGNILNLSRNGSNDGGTLFDQWDDLLYIYENNSNKLLRVSDGSTSSLKSYGFNDGNPGTTSDYDYDDNGNLTKDLNKGIYSITYNHLNLPIEIKFDPIESVPSITYVYDATGVKLQKTLVDEVSHSTFYAGNYFYEGVDNTTAQLQFFGHPEGYIKPVANTDDVVKGSTDGETTYSAFKYVFQYLDHLGNVRLSYADNDLDGAINPNSEIIEESNYYPFGMKQKGYNMDISSDGNSLAQQWKYNGIEFNEDLDLDLYEMDLRQYDPAIGRWTGIDPIIHPTTSPYSAFNNNPIYWADPSGADGISPDLEKLYMDGATTNQVHEFYSSGGGSSNNSSSGTWTYSSGGQYYNSTTNEYTNDWRRAVRENSIIFGGEPLKFDKLMEMLGTTNKETASLIFEHLFQKWANENYWTFKVPFEHYRSAHHGDVLPDGVSTGITLRNEMGGIHFNIVFWDAKASSNSVFGKNSTMDPQIQGFIEVLSKLNVKDKSKNVLVLVTTADVVNINAIRNEGEKAGIAVNHLVAYFHSFPWGNFLTFKQRIWTGVPEGGGKPYYDVDVLRKGLFDTQESIRIIKQ